jgi:hypothetical protein
MCTRGEYRGVLHDRYFSAASSFQIGVSRDRRTCSSGMLASVRYLRLENGDEVGRCRARREGRRIASATSPAGWKGSDEAAAQPASPLAMVRRPKSHARSGRRFDGEGPARAGD